MPNNITTLQENKVFFFIIILSYALSIIYIYILVVGRYRR